VQPRDAGRTDGLPLCNISSFEKGVTIKQSKKHVLYIYLKSISKLCLTSFMNFECSRSDQWVDRLTQQLTDMTCIDLHLYLLYMKIQQRRYPFNACKMLTKLSVSVIKHFNGENFVDDTLNHLFYFYKI